MTKMKSIEDQVILFQIKMDENNFKTTEENLENMCNVISHFRKALQEYGQQCKRDVVEEIAREEGWEETTRDFYLKRIRG